MAASKRVRSRLSEAQGHRCCYCGICLVDIPRQHNSTTLDHLIPKTVDEWNAEINLVVACKLCNEGRGTMPAASYFDLVSRLGRSEANRLGRLRQKGDPPRLREKAISQHLRGPMYRVLRKEYSKRIACLEGSTTKALSY